MKRRHTLLLILLTVMAQAGFSQALTDSMLIHYWFNGNAADHSGNGYDGVISGATPTMDRFGQPNGAYSFDGQNDYIEFPNVAALKPDLPMTFALWVKLRNLDITDNEFFSTDFQQDNYNGVWMTIGGNFTGHLAIGYGGGLGNTASGNRRSKLSNSHPLTTSTWHFIAGVIRGPTDMDLYVDCQLTTGTYTGSGPTQIAYTNTPGRLGAMDANTTLPAYYFDGEMDEFIYWNRALTTAEIIQVCEGELISSVEDNDFASSPVKIYPHPITSTSTFAFDNYQHLPHLLEVFDLTGRNVLRIENILDSEVTIERPAGASGIYLYRLADPNGFVRAGRIAFE